VLKEHMHCREACALFDVSHMGQLKYYDYLTFRIYGKDREEFVQTLTVADLAGMKSHGSSLTLILNEKAGIIDDAIVTKFDDHM
jgi:aminomethyltransferase